MTNVNSARGHTYQVIDFVKDVAYHFNRDRVFILASSVVYSTLISMVPFLAFPVALLSGFGVLDEVQQYLQTFLLEQFGEAAETGFIEMVEEFLINAGSLGVIGLVSFLFTSTFMLNRMWMTVNQIYRTSIKSNLVMRFGRFVTVLVIGTLLLSAYVSLTTFLRSLLRMTPETTLLLNIMRMLSPWVFIFLAPFLIILLVPDTKVNPVSALIGSCVSMVLFQISNYLFVTFVSGLLNYSIIYGSLATILIFLLWVYWIWVIIFFGVEVSYVHQYRPGRTPTAVLPDPPSEQIARGIDVLTEIANRYKTGKGSTSVKDLAEKLPGQKLNNYLNLLEKTEYIIRVDKTGRSYIPSRPLEDLNIRDVAQALFGPVPQGKTGGTPGEFVAYQVITSGMKSLRNQHLLSLVTGNRVKGNQER